MAERKKPRGRKAADSMKVETPLTKEEKAIIHWVRKNVATKTTKFLHSHKVRCKRAKDCSWYFASELQGDKGGLRLRFG